MTGRWLMPLVVIATALGALGAAPALDFSAALVVRSPGGKATGVEFDAGDVSSRLADRPVLHVKAG